MIQKAMSYDIGLNFFKLWENLVRTNDNLERAIILINAAMYHPVISCQTSEEVRIPTPLLPSANDLHYDTCTRSQA